MHHVVLERWSRGTTALHRRDPRAKLLALGVFLVTLATARRNVGVLGAILLVVAAAGFRLANLPARSALLRAAAVFPFTLPFAAFVWIGGDAARAASITVKSYVSAVAVLLLVATTPVGMLLRGLEACGAPRFLLMVAQFLYRYLFVISEEAQHMRKAAAARSGPGARRARYTAAAGAVGALFAKSYARAEEIHRAMLARGFTGRFPTVSELRFGGADAVFALMAALAPVAARAAAERLP